MRRFPIDLPWNGRIIFTLVAVMFLLMMGDVQAAGLVPCGGPGEAPCQACHITELINNVVAWLFVVLSVLAAIMIAVAGFRLVTSGGNAAAMGKAKDTLTNIIIGFIILMGGWIFIDTVMKALVTGQVYGVWNQIQCTGQPGAYNTPAGSGRQAIATSSYRGPTGGSRGPLGQCHPANLACSVDSLRAAGFNERQAQVMSCIAMTESSGNPNAHNPAGGGMGACGTFQVRQPTWNSVPRSAGCQDYASSCRNHTCNAEVARQLVERRNYRDWTCPGCNSRAQGCINRFGGQ
jgi:hypothetical protein